MKKTIALLITALLLCLAACGEDTTETTAPACIHSYEETVLTQPTYTQEGEKKMICSICGQEKTEKIPVVRTVKVLAIGNSFSVDAMEHLYGIFHDAGFTDIYLGNLYIGGCSLDAHWNNWKRNTKAYTYYWNDRGVWQQENGKTILECLESQDWDVVTLQQASHDSGKLETYGNLQNLVDAVKETAPQAKLYWHMTWAYQADSIHGGFLYYGNDQLRMYTGIATVAQMKVAKTEGIDGFIPSGTAIQNLRTTSVGDTLTRDGYHLSYGLGRYTAAMTWFAALTGLPVEAIDYVPMQFGGEVNFHLAEIKTAVAGAMETPFEVTDLSK